MADQRAMTNDQLNDLLQMYAELKQQIAELPALGERRLQTLEARIETLEADSKALRRRMTIHDQQVHKQPSQGWS
jgi:uncharacterized coiled-coil DUF342 family protein